MIGPQIEYNYHFDRLEAILKSLDRPGDYFVRGRAEGSMPGLSVHGVGTIAFPILEPQIRALINVAEQAPYGRGPDTIVDRSVRDCWQIDANDVETAGAGWDRTLRSILTTVTEGMGCAADSLEPELYKLLIYEPGGFFSEHRDTEKTDGMVGTLVVSLPTDGTGGELVVRHMDRTETIDMQVNVAGEAPFAAFYADCVHQTQPVRTGHRVSLVYNLVIKPGAQPVPAAAADYSRQTNEITEILSQWAKVGFGPRKIVWMLEHEYSETGLSHAAFKGLDAAVARILSQAAERAACSLHSAVLSISESGIPDCDYLDEDDYGREMDRTGEPIEMIEVSDWTHRLHTWSGVDLTGSELPQIPLLDEEALPVESLDEAQPDEQTLFEASGNAGVSLERSYRLAALVIWPRSRELSVIADGRIDAAVQYAWRLVERGAPQADIPAAGSELVSELISAWPQSDVDYCTMTAQPDQGRRAVTDMLRLLTKVSDDEESARFLIEIVATQYERRLNGSLAPFLAESSPSVAAQFLPAFITTNLPRSPAAVFALLAELRNSNTAHDAREWERVLGNAMLTALHALPDVLSPPLPEGKPEWRRAQPKDLNSGAVRDLFVAAHGLVPPSELEGAAGLMIRYPKLVEPVRTLPVALIELSQRVAEITGSRAYTALWQVSAGCLLQRSATPPEAPRDQRIDAPIQCRCEFCQVLKEFCQDRVASSTAIKAALSHRAHLETTVARLRLDIECRTLAEGRPYTLILEKVPLSFPRRVKEYRKDIKDMRRLVDARPSDGSTEVAQSLAGLREAVARAKASRGSG